MKATSRFLPRASSPLWVDGTVGQHVARGDLLALVDDDLLVDGGVLVRTAELGQAVDLAAEVVAEAVLRPGLVLDDDLVARHLDHGALALGQDHVTGVAGGAGLHAGPDVRRLGHDQRDGLLLHVGAHQGPVGVVVLDEGDQGGGDRHDLLRRDVHQVDLGRRHEVDLERGPVRGGDGTHPDAGALRASADEHLLLGEMAVVVEGGRRLGDDVLLLLVGGQVDDLFGHLAVDDLAVRASR